MDTTQQDKADCFLFSYFGYQWGVIVLDNLTCIIVSVVSVDVDSIDNIDSVDSIDM